jgi:phage shock protein A
MNENIVSRVSRLISGSINSIVDIAEGLSPELVMKESINEVDSIISEVKVLLGKEVVIQKTTLNKLNMEKEKYNKLLEQIKVALEQNREDLAKVAISKQLDIESQLPILEESLTEVDKNIEKLENYIDALNAKKREMHDELIEYNKIKKEQKIDSKIESNIKKADDAFNRVNSNIEKSLVSEDEIKLSELDKLTRDNRINERLQSLKENISK